jgi:signal transduction histidine kinase
MVNNAFFLVSTGITIIIGAKFHTEIRQREFVSRCELDKNRIKLEDVNTKLAEQNDALNQANREIKEAEMQIVQSEKMSSLGRFSAGLMHDILNPLNYARTGLFVLRKKTRKLPPEIQADTEPVLADIEDGLKRVDNIVSDLRTFTHPGEQPAELLDLADIFNVSLRFISGELKEKNVQLELALTPGQKIWVSRNQFILVLVNLLENALDALGEKKFAEGTQGTIRITSRLDGDRSLIFIRDNGPGIDPKNVAKIFDPFFTTKDIGQGTGLGLSICFGIIRSYGGSISVNSELGNFCEFTLDLPATETIIEHGN